MEQLALLEQFLKANRMTQTAKILRQQLFARIPQQPSSQLLQIISPPNRPKQPQKQQKKALKTKKQQLAVDGLLGKIAYSSNLLEDMNINQKISKLIDNRIFQKAVGKMFPQNVNKFKELQGQGQQYEDELDHTVKVASEEDPSAIFGHQDVSIVSQPSYVLQQLQRKQMEGDQYEDDNDLGYDQYDFAQSDLMKGCAKLTQKYGYPDSAVRKYAFTPVSKKKSKGKFDNGIVFPPSQHNLYPLQYNDIIYDVMNISVIYQRERIGFEDNKEPQWKVGEMLMGRYQIMAFMGNGVFARVMKVKDLFSDKKELTCFKIVSNNKDFLDQAMDQIKLLRLIKANCDPDASHLLNFKKVYYYRQHLMIQTDLLKDNLYAAYRKNPSFFSVPTIKTIARQILTALATIHSLNIIHSDLKPQNILIKQYSPVAVKVVDLGNSCFVHDTLGTYVQSRSYRAPQVILGNGYDFKIDVWSVGCILAELWTKNVLFYNLHVPGMLARMQSILGAWPEWMLQGGSNVSNYFSKENLIFFEQDAQYHILIPKKTTLKHRIRSQDKQFIDFLNCLLQLDPHKRPSAQQALNHSFLH